MLMLSYLQAIKMGDPAKPTYWYPRPKKVELKNYIFTQDSNGGRRVYKPQNEELMQAWLDAFKPGQEQGWYDDSWQAEQHGPGAPKRAFTSEEGSWAEKPNAKRVKQNIGADLERKIKEAEVLCEVRRIALAKAQVALQEAGLAVKDAELEVADADLAASQAEDNLKKLKLVGDQ